MLGVKLIGGAVLLGVSLGYCLQGVRSARRLQRRSGAWISLLTYVRGQIACFARPLPDILMTADRGVLRELGIDPMKKQALSEYCRADAVALQAVGGSLLLALSEELGTVWRQEQVERLDYYIAALEKAYRIYTAKLSDQLRIRCTVTLCGAGGILLLVW